MKVDYEVFFKACAKLGYNVLRACEIAGLNKNTAANIKAGKHVRPTTVYKLAKALNIDTEQLIKAE